MNDFLKKTHCDRCKNEFGAGDPRIMSFMNTDTLCIPCADKEKLHPYYPIAKIEERKAVLKGNYNYPGLFAGQQYPDFDILKTGEALSTEKDHQS